MSEAPEATDSARVQLAGLPARGIDWRSELPQELGDARPAAVLVLFGVLDSRPAETVDAPVARDLDVLLQRRAATLGSHAGQISFPGGRAEEGDGGTVATALREAAEETGLDPSGVAVLGELPELLVPASLHRVTPVLAWWDRPSTVAAVDYGETERVFRAPVADLLNPDNRSMMERSFFGRTFRSPVFDLGDGLLVWGFTAMVLDRILDEAGWTIPWNRERIVNRPL